MLLWDRSFFAQRRRFVKLDVGAWNDSEWIQRRALLQARPQPPPILFLGDSCMAYGIRPGLIDPLALNMARPGLQSNELGELYLKLRNDLKGTPRAVYLGMMWFEFYEAESEASFLDGHPVGLGTILRDYYERRQLSQQLVFPGTRVLRYGVDKGLDRNLKPMSVRVDPDGYAPLGDQPAPAVVSAPVQFYQKEEGWFGPSKMVNLAAFHRHLSEMGVEQTFIFMPMHPHYRKVYRAKFGEDHKRWKAAVTAVYVGRVLDLEDVLPEAKYYRDATHLNREGAEVFSRMIGERIAERPK